MCPGRARLTEVSLDPRNRKQELTRLVDTYTEQEVVVIEYEWGRGSCVLSGFFAVLSCYATSRSCLETLCVNVVAAYLV